MRCPSCGYENPENAPYCSMCQAAFIKPGEAVPRNVYRPVTEAIRAAAPVEKLNWFQQHLNITFLSPFLTAMLAGLAAGLTGYEAILNKLIFQVIMLADIMLLFFLGAWYIHRKNRSFAWLALLLLPLIALVVFLCLENRRDEIRYMEYRRASSPQLTPGSKHKQSILVKR